MNNTAFGIGKFLRKLRASILWRFLAAQSNAGDVFPMTGYGVRMRANWRDRTFRYCYFATYGRNLADFIASVRGGFVFVDIGANQGLYSLLAARNPDCCRVIALEPVPATFELLKANIAANQSEDRIEPVMAALSDRRGMAEIAMSPTHSGTASLHGPRDAASGAASIRLMDMEELDALLGGEQRMIVKVDVEGHEEVVLRELSRSRHVARIDAIFYEVAEKWTDAGAIEKILADAGFRSFTRFGLGRHYDVLAQR